MSTDTGETRTSNGDTSPVTTPVVAPPPDTGTLPKALGGLTHGGLVVGDEAFADAPGARGRADLSAESDVLGATPAERPGTPFGYLFPNLADRWPHDHLPAEQPAGVVAALKALGSAMIEGDPPAAGDAIDTDSTIPPIYTYWGQFIDHDLTANTDRDADLSIVDRQLEPEDPVVVVDRLRNLREPALNLDSVYGDGPGSPKDDAVPYVGDKLAVGTITEGAFPRVRVPGVPGDPDDAERDLPRPGGVAARIGDGRNDENLIVAQLHVAFLRFHNAVVDQLVSAGAQPAAGIFEEARRLVRWTYQWLVRHDFLTTLVPAETLAAVDAAPRFAPIGRGVYMPLEFSVAAFRFGHSMVRAQYDYNRNFGRPDPQDPVEFQPRATFEQLFQFTGKASPAFAGFADTLPNNWPIEWARFVEGAAAGGADRVTRRIDTRLALPLDGLLNEGTDPNTSDRIRSILKRLAVRNLMRGYKLALPTGQAVARELDVPRMTVEDLTRGENRLVRHALRDGGFLEATPLWFYVLKEAENDGGNQLGPIGGRIVAETIIGQLRHDPTSYLASDENWSPEQAGNPAGFETLQDYGGPNIQKIADLLTFAKVL